MRASLAVLVGIGLTLSSTLATAFAQAPEYVTPPQTYSRKYESQLRLFLGESMAGQGDSGTVTDIFNCSKGNLVDNAGCNTYDCMERDLDDFKFCGDTGADSSGWTWVVLLSKAFDCTSSAYWENFDLPDAEWYYLPNIGDVKAKSAYVSSLLGIDGTSADVRYFCAIARRRVTVTGKTVSDGCFAPDTPIQLASGEWRNAEDIRKGDEIYNPLSKKGEVVSAVVESPERGSLIELGFGEERLHVTTGHPIPKYEQAEALGTVNVSTTGNGPERSSMRYTVVRAADLKEGDLIRAADGRIRKLEYARSLPARDGQTVINFILAPDTRALERHMLNAGGFITGDLVLQKRLVAEGSFSGPETSF